MSRTQPTRFESILEKLERARIMFLRLLDKIPEDGWGRRFPGEGWTIKQEMVHIVQVLDILPGAIRHASRGGRRSYLAIVPASLRNWVNGHIIIPFAARGATRQSTREAYNKAHDTLLDTVTGLSEEAWSKGMPYPQKYRSMEQLALRPVEHFEEHLEHLQNVLGIKIEDVGIRVSSGSSVVDVDEVVARIHAAFANVGPPPRWRIIGSDEGPEPAYLMEEFANIQSWRSLSPEVMDFAPRGLASALSLFSDEAFRDYLPAYLVASIYNRLQKADPLFHLCHGFESDAVTQRINPSRYGARTWRDYAAYRFAMFTPSQASAIVSYLNYQLLSNNTTSIEKKKIREALENYWSDRVD